MMPRFVPKTYSRNKGNDSSYGSQAFDDLLHDNRGPSTVKSTSTAKAATKGSSKWGKTTFTSTRMTAVTPTPMEELHQQYQQHQHHVDVKKRRVEPSQAIELFDDPFSFDDGGPAMSRKMDKCSVAPVMLGQKPTNKSLAKPVPVSRVLTMTLDDSDEEMMVKKTAIKTYAGRSNKNGSTKNVIKPLDSSSTSSNNKKQMSIDAYTQKIPILTITQNTNAQKMPILTISRERINQHNQQQAAAAAANAQPLKKKFFVTSPTKSVDDDHNYSHKDQGSNAASSQGSKLFESDYELDSDEELESGDPEITFNSSKRRAMQAHGATEPQACASDDNDTDPLPDNDDIGRISPFSISDDDDSLPSRSSSQRPEVATRYTASYSATRHTLTLTKSYATSTPVRSASQPLPSSNTGSVNERKPIFTYSRSRGRGGAAVTNYQPSKPQTEIRPSCSDVDQDGPAGRLKPDRFARADSPASVGSASSGTSTSSTTGNQRSLTLTYSRKSRSDPSNMCPSKQHVRKLLTSPKKSVAVYNPRPWSSADTDGQAQPDQDAPSTGSKPPASVAAKVKAVFDDFDADDDPPPVLTQPKFRRRVSARPESAWSDQAPVSKLRITKEHKPLFTVVRNVKQAHECQEHGETQEFEDDIDYILDGLQSSQKETLRCLSTISLVSKSAMPAFRMHLRAHGTITKIYSALQDAPDYPTLALCTAGVMFMLSRDRLNMELDKTSLQLMLNLLSVDASIPTERAVACEYDRMKKRIHTICESLNIDGKARQFQLDLNDISPCKLAMESLLSLTSRKAGDWFKEEVRELGGLQYIVSTVSGYNDSLDEVEIEPTSAMLDTLKKIDRCLRVLENVTMMNPQNQNFLLHYNDSELTVAVCGALRVCENCQPFNPVELDNHGQVNKEGTGYIVFSCMLSVLRVLLNITHDNEYGSRAVGQQSGIITTLLRCVLQVPQYISLEHRFDLLVLTLGLLINMIEQSDANRQILAEEMTPGHYNTHNTATSITATAALAQFFVAHFNAAERMEAEQARDHEQKKKDKDKKTDPEDGEDADASGVWQESESGLEWVVIPENERGKNGRGPRNIEDVMELSSDDEVDELVAGSVEDDENFTKALHKAGRHMEDSIIAAYVSVLIGVIIQNNTDLVDEIKDELPGGSFEPMIKMLKKFLGFMNFTSSVSNGGKSIKRVIQTLEVC